MSDALWRDVRYAWRSLRRTPGFTAAATLTFALGIGANVAIFTLLDAVVFKPLPVPGADELVAVYETAPTGTADIAGGTGQQLVFSYPRFARLQEALGQHGTLAAMTRSSPFIVRAPERARVDVARAQLVSGGYFKTLRTPIMLGRPLTEDDARVDRPRPVAVVSDRFAARILGGAARAIGQTLTVNNLPITIVGVAGSGFAGTWTDTPADLWLPLPLQRDLGYRSNVSSYANAARDQPWVSQDQIAWLTVIGRIPATELPRIHANLAAENDAGLADLAATFVDDASRQQMLKHGLAVEPLLRGFSGLRERFGDALLALGVMVAVLLFLTCANIANLLLARATRRVREFDVRMALGATRWMVFRQCVTESGLLAIAGAGAGVLIGQWASQVLASEVLNIPRDLLPPAFFLDRRMLAFAVLATATATLLFGIVPAWKAADSGRRDGFRPDQRGGLSVSTLRSMRPFVIAQLAMSFVLVIAAALFGRTLVNFARLDPGFNPDGVVDVTLDPVLSGYTREQMPVLSGRVLTAVRNVPGVVSAAFSFCALGANCTSSFRLLGAGGAGDAPVQLHNSWVGPGYFTTLGIRRVSGREFTHRDSPASPRVAVISESIARRYFPGENAVGKRVGYQQFELEIVGVVGDIRPPNMREPPLPAVYMPIAQPPAFTVPASNLNVRVAGNAGEAALAIGEAIQRAEPGLVVDMVRTLDERLGRALLRERLIAYLAWAFGLLALFLACVGLYGVLSYAVTGRTKEIGVRVALGAQPRLLATMVLRDAVSILVPGIVLGGIAAASTASVTDRLLFGVTALDPSTYAATIGVLAVVTIVGALVPARRAAMLDPVRALQTD
jgi:predicted permease